MDFWLVDWLEPKDSDVFLFVFGGFSASKVRYPEKFVSKEKIN